MLIYFVMFNACTVESGQVRNVILCYVTIKIEQCANILAHQNQNEYRVAGNFCGVQISFCAISS